MTMITDIQTPRETGLLDGISAFFGALAAGHAAALDIESTTGQGRMDPDQIRTIYLRHFG